MINSEFNLKNLPNRPSKPRNNGITMIMDKGLSCRQAEDFLEVARSYLEMLRLPDWEIDVLLLADPEAIWEILEFLEMCLEKWHLKV